eukprot:scaffold36555_cov51-Attheya_sp.AAC.9
MTQSRPAATGAAHIMRLRNHPQTLGASVVLVSFLMLALATNTVQVSAFSTTSAPVVVVRQSNSRNGILKLMNPLFAARRSTSNMDRPMPRRNLKKRPGRRNKGDRGTTEDNTNNRKQTETMDPNVLWETRPLIKSEAVEAGEDYWIDEFDLQKSLERQHAIQNRKAMEGEIPQKKLQDEIVAPYKQNWIGFLSVVIVILATIIKTSPELLNSPSIPFPDL